MPTENIAADKVFFSFHKGEIAANEQVVKQKRLGSKNLVGHFYLAPLNIIKGQIYLAILSLIIALGISAIRSAGSLDIILIMALIGGLIGLPYLIFYHILKISENISNFLTFAYFSFGYSLLVSAFFVIFALGMEMYGAVLIPFILSVIYALEIVKLRKLIKAFQEINLKSSKTPKK